MKQGKKDTLKGLHERLVFTLEDMTDAFVSLDRNWRYTYMNKRAGEIFGRNPREMIGKHIWTEFPECIGQPFQLAYERAMMEQCFISLEEYYPPYDKWFENRIYPSEEGLSIFFSDITGRKKCEQELLKSRELFKSLTCNSPDHIILQDKELRYKLVINPQLDLKEEDMVGMTDFDFLTKDEAVRLTRVKTRVMETGRQEHFETSLVSKSGEINYFKGIYTPKQDDSGKVEGLIGYFRNITERVKAEETLRESEERFRTYVDQASDAIFVHDFSGRFLDVNYQACNSTGYSREELLGMNVLDLETDFDLQKAQAAWARIQPGMPFTLYGHHRRKDGSSFPVEVHFGSFELKGERYYMGLVRNISERRRIESALRESEKKYRTLVDNMDEGLLQTDPDDVIIYANRRVCEISGYSQEELTGKPGYKILEHPDFRSVIIDKKKQRLKGLSDTYEVKWIRKSGETIWVRIHGVPVTGIDGKVTGSVGIIRDITEQKRKDETMKILIGNLVESEEAMRKSAAQNLHDQVGQNLTALSINLNYILTQMPAGPGSKTGNRLRDSLSILNETMENIRDIMVELRPAVLDNYGLNAAMNWSVEKFAQRTDTLFHYEGQDLKNPLPRNTEFTMFRVAQELLHNVVKYAKADSVFITLEETDDHVKLTVQDDGIGFNTDTISEKKSVSGLGLAGMKTRMDLVGGTMDIVSFPGKGTSVIIKSGR